MGTDLAPANRIWAATRWWTERMYGVGQDVDAHLDFFSVVAAVCALLESKKLAQKLIDESWEDLQEAP